MLIKLFIFSSVPISHSITNDWSDEINEESDSKWGCNSVSVTDLEFCSSIESCSEMRHSTWNVHKIFRTFSRKRKALNMFSQAKESLSWNNLSVALQTSSVFVQGPVDAGASAFNHYRAPCWHRGDKAFQVRSDHFVSQFVCLTNTITCNCLYTKL